MEPQNITQDITQNTTTEIEKTSPTCPTCTVCIEGVCLHIHSAKCITLTATLLSVGVVIGLLASVFLPPSFGNYKKGYQAGNEAGYQTGFSKARKLVEDSKLGSFFKIQADMRSISGEVTAVEGNRITLHSQSMENPFDGAVINDRVVIIATGTQVIKRVAKDVSVFKAEMYKFTLANITPQSTSTSKTKTAIQPLPYTQTIIDFSNIKVGDQIVAVSLDNLKNLKEFTATEVQIIPKIFIK